MCSDIEICIFHITDEICIIRMERLCLCGIISDQSRSPSSAGSLQYRSNVPYIIPAVSNNAVAVYCSPDGCLIPSAQPQVPLCLSCHFNVQCCVGESSLHGIFMTITGLHKRTFIQTVVKILSF